ncbi:MAG TPA: deoxyguanosinetriphosphate triphosphohydrolase [Actinomycetota bacterium]|nr:deoxyguanosinetriphosphate triphosphohydrolase [Actinomycetota bacterium]
MTSIRQGIEENEFRFLAPQASKAVESKGRRFPEEPHPFRTAYQRDRDRILHSKAFRRLAHKTQVFPAPLDDHYRVRLTHTLEVTQIARTAARALRLNEDLTEAICLGHDLGHTPFGHLGEQVLSDFLGRPFRHNEQSRRLVDHLQWRGEAPGNRPGGLNLTWEVRDGILNHTWSMPLPTTLEAQVARYADRIAYLSHDIEDAIRAEVLNLSDLPEVTNRVLGKTTSARIDAMVGALVDASVALEGIKVTPEVFEAMSVTRSFMFERVYNRPESKQEHRQIIKLLRELVEHYRDHPEDLPPDPFGDDDFESRLIDYVSGMTDRFAIREHERLCRRG